MSVLRRPHIGPHAGIRTPNKAFTGGAAPGFDPSTVAGLAAWYKADVGTNTTVDGAAVTQWNDQSGNARHLVQANIAQQPVFKAAIQNGLPGIRGAGAAGHGQLSFTAGAPFITGTTLTAFAVFVPRGTGTTNERIFCASDGTNTDFSGTNRASLILLANGNTAGPYTPGAFFNSSGHNAVATVAAGAACQSTIVFDGANASMYQNGTLDPAAWAAVPGPFSIKSLSAGADLPDPGAAVFNGDICELLLYSTALNATDRVNVQNYLKARWATP